MKNSISLTWLIGLVIGFILLFSAFLVLTIQYSAVFRQKNGVIALIEKNNGYSEQSVSLIGNYLSASGYKGSGVCPQSSGGYEYMGVDSTGNVEEAQEGKTYSYCISANKPKHANSAVYYRVVLFFKFNLANSGILENIFTFKVNGLSKNVYGYSNKYSSGACLPIYNEATGKSYREC